jgi:hypothetical protein
VLKGDRAPVTSVPVCLDFHETERPVFPACSRQVRRPMFTRSVGRRLHYKPHPGPLFEVLAEDGSKG